MAPSPQQCDYTGPLLASQEFFNRSTRALDEADSQFRPQEAMMTAAQQVAHTAQTLDWFVEGAGRPEGFDMDFEKAMQALNAVTSLAAARAMLEEAYGRAIGFIGSLSPEQLNAPLPPGPIMGGMPVSSIIGAMVEHTAHHRGVLSVYARLLGKVPPMPYAD